MLQPGELVLWSGRPHKLTYYVQDAWIGIAFIGPIWLLMLIGYLREADQLGGLLIFSGLLIVIPAGMVIWRMLDYKLIWYALTNQRVLLHTPTLRSIPIQDVKSSGVQRGLFETFIGSWVGQIYFADSQSSMRNAKGEVGYNPATMLCLTEPERIYHIFEQVVASQPASIQSQAISPNEPETILWQGKPNPRLYYAIGIPFIATIWSISGGLVAEFRLPDSGMILLFTLAFCLIGSLMLLAYLYLSYRHASYVITNQRIITHRGVIGTDISNFYFSQISRVEAQPVIPLIFPSTATITIKNNQAEKLDGQILQPYNRMWAIHDYQKVLHLIEQQRQKSSASSPSTLTEQPDSSQGTAPDQHLPPILNAS